MGLVVHGMAGFEYDKARTALSIPDTYAVEAMFTAGYPGDPSKLPEALAARETPSSRRPTKESNRRRAVRILASSLSRDCVRDYARSPDYHWQLWCRKNDDRPRMG